MRFYTKQHQLYCGIDLHARTMSLCVFHQDGEILVHRNMPAGPEPFLKAIAPSREDLVVCVACLFPWYWRADLCARAGLPLVLGPALSRKAMHGGKAQNDTIAAQNMAVRRRGGMLPHASGYPADMRATRDLLRRRIPLRRKRAALLTPVQQTNRQYHGPELGTKSADTTTLPGVAERCADPAARAVVGDAGPRPRPTGPGLRVLWPRGHMRPGIGREAFWHLRHEARPRVAHVGLFRSGGPVPPHQSCGPQVSGPLRENTQAGQGLDGLGAAAGPGGLCHVATEGRVRSGHLAPELREGSRRACSSPWVT